MVDIRDLKVGDKVIVHWRDNCDEADKVVSIQTEVTGKEHYSIELLKHGWFSKGEDLDFI